MGAVPTALDVVDGEVRELIRRRGLDPFTDPGPVRFLVCDVVAEYSERSLNSALPPIRARNSVRAAARRACRPRPGMKLASHGWKRAGPWNPHRAARSVLVGERALWTGVGVVNPLAGTRPVGPARSGSVAARPKPTAAAAEAARRPDTSAPAAPAKRDPLRPTCRASQPHCSPVRCEFARSPQEVRSSPSTTNRSNHRLCRSRHPGSGLTRRSAKRFRHVGDDPCRPACSRCIPLDLVASPVRLTWR